ncbi:MAG: nucleotidyltransferase domain-containing protein [Chloroflexaceae bacterium]|nr:nucleotidyltransferase domain-containing protein [Chloroflexaceae bacterium]NJO05833.1 nucleotidyltransferase domain-containing protein [Chloroflexaceae bacterium]
MVPFEQIQDISEQIARRFQPQTLILFGSYAYGQPTNDSDIDMLIIMPFSGSPARVASTIRMQLERYPAAGLDLVVHTPDDITRRLKENDYFLQDILTHGKVLYEAPDQRDAQMAIDTCIQMRNHLQQNLGIT